MKWGDVLIGAILIGLTITFYRTLPPAELYHRATDTPTMRCFPPGTQQVNPNNCGCPDWSWAEV